MADPLTIDGAYGEGGGQILRSALGLAEVMAETWEGGTGLVTVTPCTGADTERPP
jgi:hypothetical protein